VQNCFVARGWWQALYFFPSFVETTLISLAV